METKETLNVLLPATEIKCGELTLKVQPFPFAKLPEVLTIMKSIGQSLYEILEKEKEKQLVNLQGKVVGARSGGFSEATAARIADIITQHFDEVIALMAIYCRVEKSVFLDEKANFSVEDGILVMLTILAVHKHFFIQRMMPMLRKVKQQ